VITLVTLINSCYSGQVHSGSCVDDGYFTRLVKVGVSVLRKQLYGRNGNCLLSGEYTASFKLKFLLTRREMY
jgi:hypothetical protein